MLLELKMKKIIKAGLLSTFGLYNITLASNPDELPEGVVDGVVVTGESVGAVTGIEDPTLTEALSMVDIIRDGFVPTEILELFSDIPKIDVSQRTNFAAMRSMFTALRNALRTKLYDDDVRRLNILLKTMVTPVTPTSSTLPLGQEFFGLMGEDLTVASFFTHLTRAYNVLFSFPVAMTPSNINTPTDWVTVQFLGLFFDNAISNLSFNVSATGLGNIDLVREVISGLEGTATLNLIFATGFQNDQQIEILKVIAEIRPKHTHIIAAAESVANITKA